MSARSPFRWLAPAALVAAGVAVLLVVSSGGSEPASDSRATTTRTAPAKKNAARKRQKTYTVKSGDVLSVIAERYDTTVDALLRLNPDIDVGGLRPGQKLKLRR
jgi:LysM repeat protein